MPKPAYLLDEHLPRWWLPALARADPTIRATQVGEPDAPPFGSTDLELLSFCESNQMILISADRTSMYHWIAEHCVAGRIFWGMLLIRGRLTTDELVWQVRLSHSEGFAEDFIDCVREIPI